jgi:uncharacterized protein YndB with AHSA1/START domain
MGEHDYTITMTVDESAAELFAAITNVRGWWSEEVKGGTQKQGDVFVFEVPDVHVCTMTLTEVVPAQKVVWDVSDSWLSFIADHREWDGTRIVFTIAARDDGRTDVTFTHVGLTPTGECYEICSDAWGSYITGSLRSLITTGKGDPHRSADTFESELQKHQDSNAGASR